MEDDKLFRDAWNKLTPTKQSEVTRQIKRCRKADAAIIKARRSLDEATGEQEKAYTKLARLMGLPRTVFFE